METELCRDGTTRTKVIRPKEYSLDLLLQEFDRMVFFEMYMKIRLLEEKEIHLNENEKMQLQRDCSQMCQNKAPMAVVTIFERIIGDTFNNSGSLTDLIYRVTLRERERENVLSNT